jgi:hypothetical protein
MISKVMDLVKRSYCMAMETGRFYVVAIPEEMLDEVIQIYSY